MYNTKCNNHTRPLKLFVMANSDIFPPLPLFAWETKPGADAHVPINSVTRAPLQAPLDQNVSRTVSNFAPLTSNNNSMQVVCGFCGCILQCLSVITM